MRIASSVATARTSLVREGLEKADPEKIGPVRGEAIGGTATGVETEADKVAETAAVEVDSVADSVDRARPTRYINSCFFASTARRAKPFGKKSFARKFRTKVITRTTDMLRTRPRPTERA